MGFRDRERERESEDVYVGVTDYHAVSQKSHVFT